MSTINLVFPHQLFEASPLLDSSDPFYIIEEYLFFNQYDFHKQKIAYHRVTIKAYEKYLQSNGKIVTKIESHEPESDIRNALHYFNKKKINHIRLIDPVDNWLQKRLTNGANDVGMKLEVLDSPMFINKKEELQTFFRTDKKKFFQTKFYIEQRKKLNILIENDDKPLGGKWSFDADNRKKYPRKKQAPVIEFPTDTVYSDEKEYINKYFSENPGELGTNYPNNFKQAKDWLQVFFKTRFEEFGPYEDAIVKEEHFLHHSLLTPMMNVGLLTPKYVVQSALKYGIDHGIPINSLEGFIRQIIGWREFIRGVYEAKGSYERTLNYWGFTRKIPASFYDGTTGIEPLDTTIHKVLKTGYCHHIERLMILSNFMLLCEFD
ncbi:MAG: cryptochrome/photolyase family protein, partial [Bacteroidota bacterium]